MQNVLEVFVQIQRFKEGLVQGKSLGPILTTFERVGVTPPLYGTTLCGT